ncbi:hypothetical protein BH11PAT4_BH11PAT4_0080 [soil metagenome]
MRRFISITLVVCLCFTGRSLAAEPDCSKVPTLSTPGKEYVVSSIRVPVGCELKLRAGVVVQFKSGATLTIQGKLEVTGEVASPVILKGASGVTWKGLVGDLSSDISVVGLEVRDSEGMQLAQPPSVFRDVHMIDNVRNTVVFGVSHFVYEKTYIVQRLWFENQKLGDAMLEVGMSFLGQQHLLTVDGVHFQAERRGSGYVRSLGNVTNVVYNNVTFSGCDLEVVSRNPLEYSVVPKSTCAKTVLPVLFVPGYGTSLNLTKMVSPPVPGQVVQGLHFVNALTPGYSVFLKSLKDSGTAYEVAHYDWRQSLEHNLTNYVIPALNSLKRKTGSRYVNVVAHSYGGILSRAYIQGTSYLGDVHKLVQVGTPNQGAVKAYPIWQAGQLPKDWAAVGSLLRLYGKDQPESATKDHDTIHAYFGSVQDLQPLYPSLKRGATYLDGSLLQYANTRLFKLNQAIPELLKRTTVATVVSGSEVTPTTAVVTTTGTQGIWPDGQVVGSVTGLVLGGDGTVPTQSAELSGARLLKVDGSHQNLPGTNAEAIITYLAEKPPPEVPRQSPVYKKVTLFSIDCPVHVVVTGPSGYRVSTTDHLVDSLTGEGTVLATQDMQWFFLPELDVGKYTVEVTALEGTPVRYWEDMGVVHEFSLKEGEVKRFVLEQEREVGEVASTELVGDPVEEGILSFSSGTGLAFTPRKSRFAWGWEASHTQVSQVGENPTAALQLLHRQRERLEKRLERLYSAVRIVTFIHPLLGLTLQYLLQRE